MSDFAARPARRPPRPPTARQLREIARRYVERYIPSVAQTEAVLWRKVRRATGLLRDGSEPAPVIDAILTDFCARKILDDDRLAHALVREYHRRGDPLPKMRGKLVRKRIPFDIIDQALRTLDEALKADGVDPRRQRALAYARRRRLGPWRRDPARRSARREKDLAALGRTGVPWGLAREIVDHPDLDLLEEELNATR
ncbi:MAG: regulator [Deltaproteobacteria bacterium]|nr:regulator [Deltaproteobacteria bacterium]